MRGGDAYNQALSEARAERTRDVMVKAGIAARRVKTVGYGRTHPRDAGTTPEAHHHNRRVEFVIDRARASRGHAVNRFYPLFACPAAGCSSLVDDPCAAGYHLDSGACMPNTRGPRSLARRDSTRRR